MTTNLVLWRSSFSRYEWQVLGTELFKTLREEHGDNFENFVFKKVVPVVGDIAADQNLGIDIESKREHLWEILDAIVNNAACTVFDGKFVEFRASRSTCLLNVQHNFNQTLLANVDMIFHSMSTKREPKILSNSPNVAVNFKSSCTSQPVRDPYCGRRPETIYHCFNL